MTDDLTRVASLEVTTLDDDFVVVIARVLRLFSHSYFLNASVSYTAFTISSSI
jgi:hypothetical protein